MNSIFRLVLAAGVVSVGLHAQSIEDRLRELESTNERILERLSESELRNAELQAQLAEYEELDSGRLAEARTEELEGRINALIANYDTSDWSSATKSGAAIRFYGFVRTDAYYNTARASDPIVPFRVLREGGSGATPDEDQFAFDVRLTRFAFDLDVGQIGSADLSAKLETDFANFPAGSRESRATPRIRLAYIDLTWEQLKLRIGQDWDIISPLYPSVHAELLLWGAGNLGDRRPQVQAMWHSEGDYDFFVEAGLGMSGAIDQIDNDGTGGSRTVADGFDSGHPHGQLRIGATYDTWVEDRSATVAVWGYLAGLETDLSFGGDDRFAPFAVGLDFVHPITETLTATGEAWYGQALSDIRGNILQNLNTATGEEIAGWGGWAEIRWQANDMLRLALGGSIDDPNGVDLSGMPGQDRNLNFTIYGSSMYDWGEGLKSGFDVIYWETQYSEGGRGNMVRFNAWTALYF